MSASYGIHHSRSRQRKMRVVILARPRDVTRKSDLVRLLGNSLDDNNAGFLELIVQADDPVVTLEEKERKKN